MPAYAISRVSVTDPEAFQKYVERMPPLLQRYEAKLIVNNGKPTPVEGESKPSTIVVLQFPDFEKAKAFYDDPDYKAAKALRKGAAILHTVVTDGL